MLNIKTKRGEIMLQGFEHKPRTSAGAYTGGGNKLMFHTTEGSTISGAIAALDRNRSWSHFLISYEEKRKIQFLEINQAGRSLANNNADGYQTNRANVIQIEIVGFAKETQGWSKAKLDWIAEVCGEIRKAFNFPLNTMGDERLSDKAFVDYAGICGHKNCPDNCVDPKTPILCADMQWRKAGDLKAGDEIIAFDETAEPGDYNGRKFRTGVVTYASKGFKESSVIKTTRGEIQCTNDHPWLCKNNTIKHGSRYQWVKTCDLNPSIHEIIYFGDPWQYDNSRDAGWLAGLLDADGSLSITKSRPGSNQVDVGLQFGQKPGLVLDGFMREMTDRGFEFSVTTRQQADRSENNFGGEGQFCDARMKGGIYEQMRLLGTIHPERLASKLNLSDLWENRPVGKLLNGSTATIISIEFVGKQEIASLTTSTKTYIAAGYLCHNTHWDPGKLDVNYIASKIGGTIVPPSIGGTIVNTIKTYAASMTTDANGNGYKDIYHDMGKDPLIIIPTINGNNPAKEGYPNFANITLASAGYDGTTLRITCTGANGSTGFGFKVLAGW